MKKLLVCGMLLGLLTSVSYAQRGRAIGGVGASANVGARFPSITPASPAARVNPNSVTTGHAGAVTNAEKNPSTVKPNATSNHIASPVGPEPIINSDVKVEKNPSTVKPNATSNRIANPVGPEPISNADVTKVEMNRSGVKPNATSNPLANPVEPEPVGAR